MKNQLRAGMKRLLHKLLSAAPDGQDYVEYDGLRLPPPSIRFCTTDWKNDEYFVNSAKGEVARLKELAGLAESSKILDIGSGQGRLAIGLLA